MIWVVGNPLVNILGGWKPISALMRHNAKGSTPFSIHFILELKVQLGVAA